MPKNKPTYNDLVSALYEIQVIVDNGGIRSKDDSAWLNRIREICVETLPE